MADGSLIAGRPDPSVAELYDVTATWENSDRPPASALPLTDPFFIGVLNSNTITATIQDATAGQAQAIMSMVPRQWCDQWDQDNNGDGVIDLFDVPTATVLARISEFRDLDGIPLVQQPTGKSDFSNISLDGVPPNGINFADGELTLTFGAQAAFSSQGALLPVGRTFFSKASFRVLNQAATAITQVVIIDCLGESGEAPQEIELGGDGTKGVTIFSSVGFDATMLDETTFHFAGAPVANKCKDKDKNGDGLTDKKCQVVNPLITLKLGKVNAVFEALTLPPIVKPIIVLFPVVVEPN